MRNFVGSGFIVISMIFNCFGVSAEADMVIDDIGKKRNAACTELVDTGKDASRCLFEAANRAREQGRTVVPLKAGIYSILSPVPSIDFGVVFSGAGWDEHASSGTRIARKSVGFVPFTFSKSSRSGFANVAFVDDQPMPGKGDWEPRKYGPWAEWFGGSAYISDVMLFGVTKFAFMTETPDDAGGRSYIRNLYGQVLDYALDFETSADVSNLTNLHFWPFWSTNEQVYKYQVSNTTPIISRRNDNPTITDLSVYGAKAAIWFDRKDYGVARGVTSKAHLVNLDCDRCQDGNLYVTGDNTSIQGVNITSQSTESPENKILPGSTSLKISARGTEISLVNFRSTYTGNSSVLISGVNNQVTITNGYFEMWGRSESSQLPAIQISSQSGNVLMLANCRFNADGWSSSVIDDRTVGHTR